MYNRRRLFIASCLPLVANGMASAICTDVMGDYARFLHLSKADTAWAIGAGSIIGVGVQFFGGALLDFLRIGRALWLAFAFHALGIATIMFSQNGWWLAIGWTFFGMAGMMVEASVNPLVAAMYPDKRTHMLSILHAWWPGGLIIGGLLAYGLSELFTLMPSSPWLAEHSWQIKMAFVYLPVVAYAVLIFGQEFPTTERVQLGFSTKGMYLEILRPAFLVLLFCMFLTASVELGTNRWVGVFIKDIIGIRGILYLVYTSGLMFVLRHFAGPLVKRMSLPGILLVSSVLSCVGLFWMGSTSNWWMMFCAATVFGVGVTFYWPTMLGVTAEKFPRGGAFLMGAMGAGAALFLSYVTTPGMGWLHDHYSLQEIPQPIAVKILKDGKVDDFKVEDLPPAEKTVVDRARQHAASITFRYMAIPAAVLIVLFGGMFVRDRRRRGGSLTSGGLPAGGPGA